LISSKTVMVRSLNGWQSVGCGEHSEPHRFEVADSIDAVHFIHRILRDCYRAAVDLQTCG
jgi:hypothetical protein